VAKLPRITGQEMVRFLQRQGFRLVRIQGSHHYFERGSTHTTVPVHGSRNLKIGTLRSILRDVDISPVEFERLLHDS
jgi:predicted RNA binding protein YcfA (HicA-like mRNA interferase family)